MQLFHTHQRAENEKNLNTKKIMNQLPQVSYTLWSTKFIANNIIYTF